MKSGIAYKTLFGISFLLLWVLPITAQVEIGPEGWGVFNGQNGPCLTAENRNQIQQSLKQNRKALGLNKRVFNRDAALFSIPLRATPDFAGFNYYSISNFVDQDPGFPNQLQDYNCGNRTYDTPDGYNHSGTDFALWPFGWKLMEKELVQVVAAEAGIIIGKEDGNFDKSCTLDNPQPWNAIYIQHADGSEAWYGHLKSGSLTEKTVGMSIEKGEYLGIVGSSGSSTSPHLHFEIYDAEGQLIDPFEGECNASAELSLWEEQMPYYTSAINQLAVERYIPEDPYCSEPSSVIDSSSFCSGEEVYFIAYLRDQKRGQILRHIVLRPDGSIFEEWESELPANEADHYPASYMFKSFVLSEDPQIGKWTYQVYFLEKSYQYQFDVCEQLDFLPPGNIRIEHIFPNPVRETLNLNLTIRFQDNYNFTILDALGRVQTQFIRLFEKGEFQIDLPVSHLDQGIYILSATDSNSKRPLTTVRFVKN